jgi:ankyrin repeat protein
LISNAVKYGNNEMVKLLIENGFDPNTQDKNGNTALHYAMSANKKKLQETLITLGANDDI